MANLVLDCLVPVPAPGPGRPPLHLKEPDDRATVGSAPCSKTHSVCAKDRSDGSTAVYPGDITTPNCHRLWFFAAEARYGYRM